VLYNGVDVLPHSGRADVDVCRKELSLPENGQIVGVVGNLYPVKGHQYLIDGIPRCLDEMSQHVVCFCRKRPARD
jgi:glycosyltransferase involved in cell wall biosynthesis